MSQVLFSPLACAWDSVSVASAQPVTSRPTQLHHLTHYQTPSYEVPTLPVHLHSPTWWPSCKARLEG